MKSSKRFDPRNILVIDFGQLGDVILSLPALRAIRQRFPDARITVAVGKSGAAVVDLSGYANATLPVDRVGLRDGSKVLSLVRIAKLVKDVRRSKYDFVIDLHSLAETNMLGFFSGAETRLFARRPGRSLDYLGNFSPPPPVDNNDPNRHLVDRYLDVLVPLGVKDSPRVPALEPRPGDNALVEEMLRKEKANAGALMLGLYVGAGHPSRRWPLARFAELAEWFARNDKVRTIVFTGPEEHKMLKEIRSSFPRSALLFDGLSIPTLAAAMARLSVLVANDTGPMHLAAAVGTATVVLSDKSAPNCFLPLGEQHHVLRTHPIEALPVEEVYDVTRALLASGRIAALFAS